MHLDRRLLGWGLFFILAGGIPLVVRAGLLDESVVGDWPLLWPLLLIGWGIGLLLRGSQVAWLGGAVVAVTFGVMAGGAITTGFGGVPIATGCSGSAPTAAFPERSGPFGATAQVDIEFNCGTLAVSTADGSDWRLSGSDRDGSGPNLKSDAGQLDLSADDSRIFDGSGRSIWNVTLPRDPSLGLDVTLNAGSGTLDLGGATVAQTSMTLNAGAMTLDLGAAASAGDVSATVNAGSAGVTLPGGSRTADLSLNAGSLKLCVPEGSPLRATWSGTLGSNNFDAAGLVQVDGSTWTTSGFDAGQPFSELHVSANAGSFELRFGGTCRA